jgi:excisionase family DNA binding protein
LIAGGDIVVDSHRFPLAWTIAEFRKETKLGRDGIYEAIADGRLIARKFGRRTLILREDGEAFLKALPALRLDSPDSGKLPAAT